MESSPLQQPPLNKAASLYKAVSLYREVKSLTRCEWGIELLAWDEYGGLLRYGGCIALAHHRLTLGDPLCSDNVT